MSSHAWSGDQIGIPKSSAGFSSGTSSSSLPSGSAVKISAPPPSSSRANAIRFDGGSAEAVGAIASVASSASARILAVLQE